MFDIVFEDPVLLEVDFNINEEHYKMRYLLKNFTLSGEELYGFLEISFSKNFMDSSFESINIKEKVKEKTITSDWLANYIIKNDIYIEHQYIDDNIINKIKTHLKTYLF